MEIIRRLKRWLDKKSLERELAAFNYFKDIEGAHDVLREMKEKGYIP